MRSVIPSAIVVAAACALLPSSFLAQVPQRDAAQPTTRVVPIGTSAITGTVVDAESGRGLVGVRVTVLGEMPPPAVRGTGSASGRGGVSAVPSGVTISLSPVMQMAPGGGRVTRSMVTDAQGAFEARHLPAGRYLVNVNHRGYLNGAVGQKKPAGQGTSFQVADGEKTPVTVKMIRGGVVTGTVYGEDGEPVSGTQVSVYRYLNMMGVRRLQQTGGANTDDRGVYRLHGLQPGDYFVAATHTQSYPQDTSQAELALIEKAIASGAVKPPAAAGLPSTVSIPIINTPNVGPFNQPPGYLPTFFPGATSAAAAQTIRVVGGDVHTNVDISVRLVSASNIEGVITNPPGPDTRVQMQVMSDDPNFVFRGGAQVRPDGNFFVNNLPPGTYTLTAATFPVRSDAVVETQTAPPSLWGRVSVTVTGEPRVLTSMTLQAGRSISGRVMFEMERAPDLVQQTVTVRLTPAPGSTMSGGQQLVGRVEPDGRFTVRGVGAGRYVLNVTGSIPSTRSATVNGQDMLDIPLEFDANEDLANVVVTVTDQVSDLSGAFTAPEGSPPGDFVMLVAPTEERYWLPGSRRIMAVALNPTGGYRVRALPAGSYFIAVLSDFEQGTQYDRAFLKELASTASVFVTIADGEKVTRDLRASGR